jgi:hypothetical protein
MNKVTKEQIESLLNSAETQEVVFWDKQLAVSYKFPSGFAIIGVGSCVDPANFDLEIGRQVAREQVEHKLWELEGYVLQSLLSGRISIPFRSHFEPLTPEEGIEIDEDDEVNLDPTTIKRPLGN